LRHRQTKGAATDMFYLTPPRHISTLPKCDLTGRAALGAKRTFVETLIPARCQEETLAAQASGILDLSSCRRGCRAADGNRTVRDERDAGGVEGVARSRAGRGIASENGGATVTCGPKRIAAALS